MKTAFNKTILRKITTNLNRYLTIIIIVALGVSFYSGVRSTSPFMKNTADKYFTDQNLYDIEIISNTLFDENDIELIKKIDGVNNVMPSYSTEVFVEKDNSSLNIKLLSLSDNMEINKPILIDGRLPENSYECIVDKRFITQSNIKLNEYVTFTSEKVPINYLLKYEKYKIVGVVESPQYISIDRGSSSIGSGSINSFIILPNESFNIPKYTNLYLTVDHNYSHFSDEYSNLISAIKTKIEDISKNKPEIKWYILDLNTNAGYLSYKQDTERIASIGKVFPLVFFLVASLVSLTSMTRMVDNDRTEIGTIKSLGYSRFSILKKYLIYAISASFIGSIIGLIIGFNLFPRVIFNAYGILYTLPPIEIKLLFNYAIQATLFAMLLVTIPAYAVCIQSFKSTPANLMRPKAPEPGKRILLERIKLFWDNMKFIQKITARNLFRYKKRLLMTVIGIAGCTALLLTGFGLRDSISSIVTKHFNKIRTYDLEISIKDNLTNESIKNLNNSLDELDDVIAYFYIKQTPIEIKNKNTDNIYLITPQDAFTITEFISLKTREKHEKVLLTDDKVVITEKLSSLLKINIGSKISIINNNNEEVEVTIGGIVENYLNHYIFMSPTLYKELYNVNLDYNLILAKIKGEDPNIANKIIENEQVRGLFLTSTIKDRFDDMIEALNVVTVVLIASAAALAFIVLFSLTSINIDERKRELATIKVLGLYDIEVSAFIYRENFFLTIIGSVVGLIFGVFLLRYVIYTAETDMVMFSRDIKLLSFIYSIVLTFIFSLLVNLIMFYRLKNINMIESLKNVE